MSAQRHPIRSEGPGSGLNLSEYHDSQGDEDAHAYRQEQEHQSLLWVLVQSSRTSERITHANNKSIFHLAPGRWTEGGSAMSSALPVADSIVAAGIMDRVQKRPYVSRSLSLDSFGA